MRGLSIRLFWNGIGEAYAHPKWREWFQKYRHAGAVMHAGIDK